MIVKDLHCIFFKYSNLLISTLWSTQQNQSHFDGVVALTRLSVGITLMVCVKSRPMRFWRRQGRGRDSTSRFNLSDFRMVSRLRSWREAMLGEAIQPKWTWLPVATKIRLSL